MYKMNMLYVFSLFSTLQVVLGMEDGMLAIRNITASTWIDGYEPFYINSTNPSEGWCPGGYVNEGLNDFIQIEFHHLSNLSCIAWNDVTIDGQFIKMESFHINYTRLYDPFLPDEQWVRYPKIINDRNRPIGASQKSINDMPLIARYIRIIPFSKSPKKVCVRLTLIGKRWSNAIVSYNMPDGHSNITEYLKDTIYDGYYDDRGYLFGGLGKLTDGVTTLPENQDGFIWIGWTSKLLNYVDVTLRIDRSVFKIDSICFSMFDSNTTETFFSGYSLQYSDDDSVYKDIGQVDAFKDVKISKVTNLRILKPYKYRSSSLMYCISQTGPLDYHEYFKIFLYFPTQDSIILMSEMFVKFETKDEGKAITDPFNVDLRNSFYYNRYDRYGNADLDNNLKLEADNVKEKMTKTELVNITVISVVGGVSGVVLIIAFFVVMYYKRSRNCPCKNESCHKSASNNDVYGAGYVRNDSGLYPNSTNWYIPPCTKDMIDRRLPTLPMQIDENDSGVDKGLLYNTNSMSGYHYKDIENNYEKPNYKTSTVLKGPNYPMGYPFNRFGYNGFRESKMVHNNVNPQMYRMETLPPGVASSTMEKPPLINFPHDILNFVQVLGVGRYGQVRVYNVPIDKIKKFSSPNSIGDANQLPYSMNVLAKVFKINESKMELSNFLREEKIMSQLDHPNLINLLGICDLRNPIDNQLEKLLVLEYMVNGDLGSYLRKCINISQFSQQQNISLAPSLNEKCLLYMAMQVACGMTFLEQHGIVHRDLAARNCLVGEQYVVKIADLGLCYITPCGASLEKVKCDEKAQQIYTNPYYKTEGSNALLPIRWMPWESVLTATYSTKSDVWSFGVLLWEIVSFCETIPYNDMNDQEVIENCNHFYLNDGNARILSKPRHCSVAVYEIIYECWNSDALARPSFSSLFSVLRKMCNEFNPKAPNFEASNTSICINAESPKSGIYDQHVSIGSVEFNE